MPCRAAFELAFVIAVGATLVVRSLARRAGVVDRPDGFRKAQAEAVPLLGGIAVFAAFYGSVLLVRALFKESDF
jgi:UDP-N-acetylmuramyl pentapeptide phosphotransferase/UDP-N-acetylglucosamine-1-phosphate transferase